MSEENEAITLANDLGVVDHAWLDAGLMHETCEDLSCRILVGDAGGIVCDMVTGPHPLGPVAAERLARAAIRNVDPSWPDPLPMTDAAGRPARIVAASGNREAPQGRDLHFDVGHLVGAVAFAQLGFAGLARREDWIVALGALALLIAFACARRAIALRTSAQPIRDEGNGERRRAEAEERLPDHVAATAAARTHSAQDPRAIRRNAR